jgi:hypothetical protein
MTRPLTKNDKDGNLYTRPPEVEKAIDAAMKQDIGVLQARAQQADQESRDYLRTECLVHIIRHAKRSGDERTINTLLPSILARCEAILRNQIRDNGRPNAAEIREEILANFSVLFAEDGVGENPDELDFYECRFNLAFLAFRINFLRSETTRLGSLVSLPAEEQIGLAAEDEERVHPLPEALQNGPMQLNSACHAELLNAVNALPPDERKAVILCCVLGLKEESDNANELTAAKLCGVTGRTIRNRLNRAARKLSRFE